MLFEGVNSEVISKAKNLSGFSRMGVNITRKVNAAKNKDHLKKHHIHILGDLLRSVPHIKSEVKLISQANFEINSK